MSSVSAPSGHLRVVNVTKHFGTVAANRSVSLDVAAGEIHGLLGENGAGKSTLMKIVAGLVAPEAGSIEVDRLRLPPGDPVAAQNAGIGMVHQDFMLVPTMTVVENVVLSKHWHRGPGAGLNEMREAIRKASQHFGLAVDPDALVEELPLGTRQRVEILRLLLMGADILIFDEPTAVLTPQEWEELAAIMRALALEGKTIIFITHKLKELLTVTTRCTVMRSGRVVATLKTSDATEDRLAQLMVGRDVVLRLDTEKSAIGPPVLTVNGISSDVGRRIEGITFTIHEGEIFGVAGVDGNGQDELVGAITGLLPLAEGEIQISGERLAKWRPRQFAECGGAAIYADRHQDAVALDLSVTDNLIMGDLSQTATSRSIVHFGWLRRGAIVTHCEQLRQTYDIRLHDLQMPLRQLSGGNQQKVVLARELSRSPKLLIAAQPTRGLDVAAIEFVYSKLLEHKRAGGATLLISTELDELLSLSDRVAIMFNGRFLDILPREKATLETMGRLLGGHIVASVPEAL